MPENEKYRNKDVDAFMAIFENDLTAIVANEFGNLDVAGVLKRNRKNKPEMTIQQATIWAMRDKAAVILRKATALAISLDRTTVMVDQMADEMSADGNENCHRYRDRLPILTNFKSILKELL